MTEASSYWQYEARCFRLTATHVEAMTWVDAFIQSTFTRLSPCAADHTVELRCDAAAHATLVAEVAAHEPQRREGFASDTKCVLMDTWLQPDGSRLARDVETGIFFRVSPALEHVEIVAAECGRSAWLAMVKVVRELAMEGIATTGGALVHCAAVATDAGALVLSGPRGSGKTTLMCALLMAGGARYVTNDRAVLRIEAGRAQVRGVPTLVSIREGTLELMPELRRAVEAHGHRLDYARNLHLAPHQFEALTSAARAPGGPVLALVYPRTVPELRGLHVRRLSGEEAAAHFAAGLFRAGRDTSLGQVFVSDADAPDGPSPRSTARDALRWVSTQGPAFELSVGAGFVPDRDACARMLSALKVERRP